MSLQISKISGVLFIKDSTNTNPKSYFSATGIYQFSDDDTRVTIKVGTDIYTLIWQDLVVGSSIPASVSDAKVLLNSIFGS
jgi:hypothetical protein